MKKICLIILCMFLFSLELSASDDGFDNVNSEESLELCLQTYSQCRLSNDMTFNSVKFISHDVIIDLNGHVIEPSKELKINGGLIKVSRGAKLTINDKSNTGKISTGDSGNVWAAIQMINENNTSNLAELVVNGGIIEGYYYGIAGNGNYHNTKITINNGIISGLYANDSAGIFQPQQGEIVINNGTITGGTGIEIRSGSLEINGGNIKAISDNFSKEVNENGTTTNGVGVAVAQHITKNPININIKGGTIEGQYAFYEWNPHGNSKTDLDKINISISGGTFTGYAQGVKSIYSEDKTGFVSGGKFSTDIGDYATSDAKLSSKLIENGSDMVNINKSNKGFVIVLSLVIVSALILGYYFVKNKVVF